jgi:hypothetical protein
VLLSVVQTAKPQKKVLTSPSEEHQTSYLCVFYMKSSNVNLHVPLLSNIVMIKISLHVLKVIYLNSGGNFYMPNYVYTDKNSYKQVEL